MLTLYSNKMSGNCYKVRLTCSLLNIEYQQKFAKAQIALSYLNEQLSNRHFILGDKISLADIGLYAYTHIADAGGIDMSAYLHLQKWIRRIESLDNYIAL